MKSLLTSITKLTHDRSGTSSVYQTVPDDPSYNHCICMDIYDLHIYLDHVWYTVVHGWYSKYFLYLNRENT